MIKLRSRQAVYSSLSSFLLLQNTFRLSWDIFRVSLEARFVPISFVGILIFRLSWPNPSYAPPYSTSSAAKNSIPIAISISSIAGSQVFIASLDVKKQNITKSKSLTCTSNSEKLNDWRAKCSIPSMIEYTGINYRVLDRGFAYCTKKKMIHTVGNIEKVPARKNRRVSGPLLFCTRTRAFIFLCFSFFERFFVNGLQHGLYLVCNMGSNDYLPLYYNH